MLLFDPAVLLFGLPSRFAALLRFHAPLLRFGAAVLRLRLGAIVAALMRGVVELLAMAALQSKSMTCDWGLKCRGALVELKRAAYNMRALHGRAFTGRVIVLRCAWLVSAWVVSAWLLLSRRAHRAFRPLNV